MVKCSDCVYFTQNEDGNDNYKGDCRRHPPIIDPKQSQRYGAWIFPRVHRYWECGEGALPCKNKVELE